MQPDLPVRTEYVSQARDKKDIPTQWWTLDGEDVHTSIFCNVERIRNNQGYQTRRNLFYGSLYENQDLRGFSAGTFTQALAAFTKQGVTWNVIRAVIDTLTSRIGTEKPKPFALTDNENWGKQQRAKKLSKYLEGMFDRTGMWKKGRTSFRDGCAVGTGCLKFHNSTGQVCVDRVLVEEVLVDNVEAIYGEPLTLYQTRYIAKSVAKELWSKHAKEIEQATVDIKGEQSVTNSLAEMVLVIEAWHLKSGMDAKDGRHVIAISNATLLSEDWEHPFFPFVFFRYNERLLGFYGASLSEEISGIQLEMNKMLRAIAIAQHLQAVPQVWLHIDSQVNRAEVNNEIGGVKYYAGERPWFYTPQAMTPEIYNYLETLWNRAFEIPGISQMSATGRKPSGVDAAVAMRTMQDIESDRFKTTQQRYEEMYIQASYIMIALEEELHKKGNRQKVKVADNKTAVQLDWAEVRLDLEDFSIRLWPTNLLPSDPSGKLQKTVELMQGGIFDQEEAVSLLDFPDTNAVTSLKTAARDDILRIIGNILDKGEYETPEPHMDLKLARKLTQLSYLKARNDNAPTDRLDLLLAFQEDVEAFIEMSQMEAQTPVDPTTGMPLAGEGSAPPPLPGGGVQPPAALAEPLPPPTSELMPVVA